VRLRFFFPESRCIQVEFKKAKGMGKNLTSRIAFISKPIRVLFPHEESLQDCHCYLFSRGRCIQVDFKKTKGMGENVTPIIAFISKPIRVLFPHEESSQDHDCYLFSMKQMYPGTEKE